MASGADRISDLPEGVLHHILSLLPAQDAVRTCVLAKSWRDHWRFAPAVWVRLAGSTDWAGGVDAFVPFVAGLLRARRQGAPLDFCGFDLDLDRSDVPKVERQGNSWIRRALRLEVWELRFRVSSTPRLPLTLEDRPLASRHLTCLELMGVQGNNSVLDFSGCPALAHLKMEDCVVGSTEMHSPSLKDLTIRFCIFYTNYRTRMWFPSLVSIELTTNVGRVPMLESMPSLETAMVRFDHFYDDRCENGRLDDCGDAACRGCSSYYGPGDYDCVFLEGLTEATDLTLSAYPQLYVFIRDLEWCPAFCKLKTLVLSDWFVTADLGALLWFLYHAPILEELTLEVSMKHSNLMKTDGSYQPFKQSIAATHLKVVEVICKDVDGIVRKILKALNANGVSLEKIRIQCSGRYNFVCTDINSKWQ